MQMINTFWQELQESWEQIKEFYKKTKVLRWFGACLMFVLYGIRFVQGEYFVDSELMLTAPEELLQSWYGHRRFALIFTRKLFGMLRLMPFMENALDVLSGRFYCAICHLVLERQKRETPCRIWSVFITVFFGAMFCRTI